MLVFKRRKTDLVFDPPPQKKETKLNLNTKLNIGDIALENKKTFCISLLSFVAAILKTIPNSINVIFSVFFFFFWRELWSFSDNDIQGANHIIHLQFEGFWVYIQTNNLYLLIVSMHWEGE